MVRMRVQWSDLEGWEFRTPVCMGHPTLQPSAANEQGRAFTSCLLRPLSLLAWVWGVGHRMAQGVFSLKGLVAAGMPTRKGSLLAWSVQNCSRSAAALDTCRARSVRVSDTLSPSRPPGEEGEVGDAPALPPPSPPLHLHTVNAGLHP